LLKFLKQCRKLNWKFHAGGKVQNKKPSFGGRREVWIFFGITKRFATTAYLLNMNQQRNWLVILAHMFPFMLAVKYFYKKRDWESGVLVAQDYSTKNCTIILRASKLDVPSCLSCQLNNNIIAEYRFIYLHVPLN